MLRNKLTAYAFKMINFFDGPSLRFGIITCTTLVMIWAFAFRLVFGRNPNPNSNRPGIIWEGGSFVQVRNFMYYMNYISRL